MPKGTSLINLGDLSKPATVLVEKIAAAIGVLYEPRHIRRVAKAEAEAQRIRALAGIEITDIQHRALIRMIQQEGRKQANIEKITADAVAQIEPSADPSKMEEDWIASFFEKCKTVSDSQMQSLWSALLAGETNQPGSFSRRTIQLVSTLDKADAILFTKLCAFAVNFGEVFPIVFDCNALIYKKAGLTFSALHHLDAIGFVRFNNLQSFMLDSLPQYINGSYYGAGIRFKLKGPRDNRLKIGSVMLTKTGQQLARICRSTPNLNFLSYLVEQFREKGYEVALFNLPGGKVTVDGSFVTNS